MKQLAPINPRDRLDVHRFYNGISADAKEGLDTKRTRVPLVKTFLLEHVAPGRNRAIQSPESIFRGLGADVRMIDDDFMGVAFPIGTPSGLFQMTTTGFVERFDERFCAYYTCEDSVEAQKRVSKWIQSPELDACWFSSPLLQRLWDYDISTRGDNKFAKLTFRHESIFEMPEDFSAQAEEPAEERDEPAEVFEDEDSAANDDRVELERRKARFDMGDRIGRIKGALGKLQSNYAPLSVLYGIRMPSRSVRGGHDLRQAGQITNRTSSFEDHRNTVHYLYQIYSAILTATEQKAWQEVSTANSLRVGFKGVPLIIRYREPIPVSTFERLVQMAFQKRNRFKLWGDPIRLGPRKVHVYGADRHLWQPINLELTTEGVVAVLPQGTCGNTFHRLVTNIQQYVSPQIDAWIGGERFEDIVCQWPAAQEAMGER